MKKWETLVDRMVKDAIGNGDISHLPGAGKPLDLAADEHTPSDKRVVYKILKDHNLVPDWMATGQALDELADKLTKQIQIRASRYNREIQEVRRKGTILKEIELEEQWKVYVEDFMGRVDRYNREVLLYNLNVPNNILHKQTIVGDKLVLNALNAG